MSPANKESVKKELLMRLGKKLYDGLADEKIALVPNAGAKDFQTELARVTTLIDYVKNKQKELQPVSKGTDRVSRNNSSQEEES